MQTELLWRQAAWILSPRLYYCDVEQCGGHGHFLTTSQHLIHNPTAHPLLSLFGQRAAFTWTDECRGSWGVGVWGCSHSPNIQRSNHNRTAKPTDAIDQQLMAVCKHSVSQEVLQIKMRRRVCLWASRPLVLAHCTICLSSFKAPHISVTVKHLFYVPVQS